MQKTKNSLRLLTLLLTIVLAISSCGNRQKKGSDNTQQSASEVPEAKAYSNLSIEELLDTWTTSKDSIMLSDQVLTSYDALEKVFPDVVAQGGDYTTVTTPAADAFFYKEDYIKDTELSRNVSLRYNYVAVMNRIVHGYDLFVRLSSSADMDEEHHATKKDTLGWVKKCQPIIPNSLLHKTISGPNARAEARALIAAFKNFDGHDDENSAFSKAFDSYRNTFADIPEIATEEMLDKFEEGFWEWYDKEQFVPGIDKLIQINIDGDANQKFTSEDRKKLANAVVTEKNIDRRAILALELVKSNQFEGVELLGDIIDSGLYTRYLLEVWISWRANVQMMNSMSSFSTIANNYYDKVRVKCLNTFLRHCQDVEDQNALCLMENMIFCEIVHRMGSIAGNSSFATCADLNKVMFIHPRLIPEKER